MLAPAFTTQALALGYGLKAFEYPRVATNGGPEKPVKRLRCSSITTSFSNNRAGYGQDGFDHHADHRCRDYRNYDKAVSLKRRCSYEQESRPHENRLQSQSSASILMWLSRFSRCRFIFLLDCLCCKNPGSDYARTRFLLPHQPVLGKTLPKPLKVEIYACLLQFNLSQPFAAPCCLSSCAVWQLM